MTRLFPKLLVYSVFIVVAGCANVGGSHGIPNEAKDEGLICGKVYSKNNVDGKTTIPENDFSEERSKTAIGRMLTASQKNPTDKKTIRNEATFVRGYTLKKKNRPW